MQKLGVGYIGLYLFMMVVFGQSKTYAQPFNFPGVPGVVVDYSAASTTIYLGSPSICILSNGNYLVSHDLFGPGSTQQTQGITRLFLSTDKGKTWKKQAEIKGQFWSGLFTHKNAVYLMGTSKEYGNTVIRKSMDDGKTWTNPDNPKQGLLLKGQYHTAPTPVIEHNGRLWRAMEDAMGPDKNWGKRFGSFMLSVPVNADLLYAENWECSNILRYDSTYLDGKFGGWLEGNAVIAPDKKPAIVLRADYAENGNEKAALVSISADGKKASFNPKTGFVDFPGGSKKFSIRYDKKSNTYWTLANYVPDRFKGKNFERTRNTLALCRSADLRKWTVRSIVLQNEDMDKHGFQYVDWQFAGNDIIAICRTAFDDGIGGAHNQHDSNFITFHRIQNFRGKK